MNSQDIQQLFPLARLLLSDAFVHHEQGLELALVLAEPLGLEVSPITYEPILSACQICLQDNPLKIDSFYSSQGATNFTSGT
jgi:hypothetical protein